jgi:hypothetical protein
LTIKLSQVVVPSHGEWASPFQLALSNKPCFASLILVVTVLDVRAFSNF